MTGLQHSSGTPDEEVVVRGASGEELVVDQVVLCAGLQVDRLAELAGDDHSPRIVPFRGEYFALVPEKRSLVNGLVYPVPDPRYPFLGVHLTPRFDGEVLVGPNAVLALAREGYRRRDVSVRELAEVVRYAGFRKFARQHWQTGIAEMRGSLSKRTFTAAAQRYVPELTVADLVPSTAGIRAQALETDGSLVDDFRISRTGAVVAVRNAPVPGRHVVAGHRRAHRRHACSAAARNRDRPPTMPRRRTARQAPARRPARRSPSPRRACCRSTWSACCGCSCARTWGSARRCSASWSASFFSTSAVAALTAGTVVRRFGTSPVVRLSALIGAVSMLVIALAAQYTPVLVGALVAGRHGATASASRRATTSSRGRWRPTGTASRTGRSRRPSRCRP